MGERKVVNKYYPPEFDPAKNPARRQPKNRQMKVTNMLPMSIRCGTCGNYMYKGTKFNMRKEDVAGEAYLNAIQILRFYFKCSNCSAEITFKTDPQNSDYAVEYGGTRNFEPWRAENEVIEEEKRRRIAQEMGDAMRCSENRKLGFKREIDIDSALEEMKSMKARRQTVTVDAMLEALNRSDQQHKEREIEEEEEEEDYIRAVFKEQKRPRKTIDDDDLEEYSSSSSMERHSVLKKAGASIKFGVINKSKTVEEEEKDINIVISSSSSSSNNGLQSLLHNYAETGDE